MSIQFHIQLAIHVEPTVDDLIRAIDQHRLLFHFYARAYRMTLHYARHLGERDRIYGLLGFLEGPEVESRSAEELFQYRDVLEQWSRTQQEECWKTDSAVDLLLPEAPTDPLTSGRGEHWVRPLSPREHGWKLIPHGAEALQASADAVVRLVGAVLATSPPMRNFEASRIRGTASLVLPDVIGRSPIKPGPHLWTPDTHVGEDYPSMLHDAIPGLRQIALLHEGARASRDFQPAEFFRTMYGIPATRLRQAKSRGKLLASKRDGRVVYSVSSAKRLWPEDLSQRGDNP